jgi:ankyrin repeat protein
MPFVFLCWLIFFVNTWTFAMQYPENNKRQRLIEAASSSTEEPTEEPKEPAWLKANGGVEVANCTGNFMISRKSTLKPRTQERTDFSNDLKSLSMGNNRLRAYLTAAQFSEIAFSLEIRFETDRLEINLVPLNQPHSIAYKLCRKSSSRQLNFNDFALDKILKEDILTQNSITIPSDLGSSNETPEVVPLTFGNVKKVNFVFDSMRVFKQFLNLQYYHLPQPLKFSEKTIELLKKIYQLFAKTNQTILDPLRSAPEFSFTYEQPKNLQNFNDLKILAENFKILIDSAQHLLHEFKFQTLIRSEPLFKTAGHFTRINTAEAITLNMFLDKISHHKDVFHFSLNDPDEFFDTIVKIGSQSQQNTPAYDFTEVINFLQKNRLMELFEPQFPPMNPSFSKIGTLKNKQLLRFLLDYAKDRLQKWSVGQLKMENPQSFPSIEFLTELVAYLNVTHFTNSTESAMNTMLILVNNTTPPVLRRIIIDQLDTYFFNHLKCPRGYTILHYMYQMHDTQSISMILPLVTPALFLTPDPLGHTPLDYIRGNHYPPHVALALLAVMPPQAYESLDASGENIFHRRFSPDIPEAVLIELFNKAPDTVFLQKNQGGNLPIHIIRPHESLSFYEKLLRAGHKRAFYIPDCKGYNVTHYTIERADQMQAMINEAPLTSFFVLNDQKTFALTHMLVSYLTGTVCPQRWKILLARLENASTEEFLRKDIKGQTFFSHLMKSPDIFRLLLSPRRELNLIRGTILNEVFIPKFFTTIVNKLDEQSLLSNTDDDGNTLLHQAVHFSPNYLEQLIPIFNSKFSKPLLSTQNNLGQTPLLRAFSPAIHRDISLPILSSFFNFASTQTEQERNWLTLKDNQGNSMLHLLIGHTFLTEPQFKKIMKFIETVTPEELKSLFSQNNQSQTPWHIALSKYKMPKYSQDALTSNSIFNKLKESVGNETKIQALEQVDLDGNTVLHKVLLNQRHHDLIKRLVKNSPSKTFRLQNRNNQTVLDLAIAQGLPLELTDTILRREKE